MLAFWVCMFSALAACASADLDEKYLSTVYGRVPQDSWVRFSPRPNISRECREGTPLRVVYFTRHTGTLWDWIAVATHLGVPWTRVNPGLFQPYGISTQAAEEHWRTLGQLMCRMGDILVFSDTIPDARPLLAGHCSSPILLQVTNRFDYGLTAQELPAYLRLMAEVAKRPNVWWVTNNPYEEHYMARRGVALPRNRFLMLRPVGECLLHNPDLQPFNASTACLPPAANANATDANTTSVQPPGARAALLIPAHSRYHLEVTLITPWLLSHNLSSRVAVYQGGQYGGPAVLAQHRGVLTVPYQVSVMKMYEGLAAGAVFVLPSPTLFRVLVAKLDNNQMVFCCRDLFTERPKDWQSLMDWYHPDFLPAHIVYDTLDELRRFIEDCEYSAALVERKRALGRAALARSRAASLAGFRQLFDNMTRRACEGPLPKEVQAEGLTLGMLRQMPWP